jgi:hypothetical protein
MISKVMSVSLGWSLSRPLAGEAFRTPMFGRDLQTSSAAFPVWLHSVEPIGLNQQTSAVIAPMDAFGLG